MKTLKRLISIVAITLFSISCSHSDDSSTTTSASNDNFISAKIDGVDYRVTGDAITGDQNSLAFNFRSDITGGGTGMDFSINGQAAVGSYSLTYSNATAAGRLNYRLNSTIYSTSICSTSTGIVTITSKNGNTIEGTFSFTGKKVLGCSESAKTITNGAFKVTL